MTSKLAVVHIGLPMNHPLIPDQVRGQVEQSLNALRDRMQAQGLTYEFAFASPESGLEAFRGQLAHIQPDAVVIGGGVMASRELRHFMEQIIEMTHRASPSAKILLIDLPDDVPAAVARWFPD